MGAVAEVLHYIPCVGVGIGQSYSVECGLGCVLLCKVVLTGSLIFFQQLLVLRENGGSIKT